MLSEKIKLLRSDNPDIRISGVESFSGCDIDFESADALSELINDHDKGVRNALLLLVSNNNIPGIAWKTVQFIKSKDLSVKNFAGELLVTIGSPAVEALMDFLDKGDNDDIKFIIDLFGIIRDKKLTEKILNVLKNTWDSNVGIACIEALGNIWEYPSNNSHEEEGLIADDTAEEIVKSLLEYYSANELFRATIIESIGKIGPAIKSQLKIDILDFIQSKFNLGDELTKLTAVECLGRIGNQHTFYFLLGTLKEAQGLLSRETIKAVSSIKERFNITVTPDEKITSAILSALVEGECEHKRAAAHILYSIESRAIMLQCLKLLDGCADFDDLIKSKAKEKPELLYEASAELLVSNESERKPLLMILYDLWHNSEPEKNRFKTSLQRMNLINAIINCIQSPDEEVRIAAAELLFIIDQKNSVYFLEELADDPNIWNRLKLIDLLEKISHPRVSRILTKLASDGEEMVREKAKSIIDMKNTETTKKD
ncbi:MAG TPA: HEAT repeat domain-containing protein [Ignavibacteriaceae bacterium]|nr:HEAT repeat domain-containing protein [Ignavibacteriaceae bacterium]